MPQFKALANLKGTGQKVQKDDEIYKGVIAECKNHTIFFKKGIGFSALTKTNCTAYGPFEEHLKNIFVAKYPDQAPDQNFINTYAEQANAAFISAAMYYVEVKTFIENYGLNKSEEQLEAKLADMGINDKTAIDGYKKMLNRKKGVKLSDKNLMEVANAVLGEQIQDITNTNMDSALEAMNQIVASVEVKVDEEAIQKILSSAFVAPTTLTEKEINETAQNIVKKAEQLKKKVLQRQEEEKEKKALEAEKHKKEIEQYRADVIKSMSETLSYLFSGTYACGSSGDVGFKLFGGVTKEELLGLCGFDGVINEYSKALKQSVKAHLEQQQFNTPRAFKTYGTQTIINDKFDLKNALVTALSALDINSNAIRQALRSKYNNDEELVNSTFVNITWGEIDFSASSGVTYFNLEEATTDVGKSKYDLSNVDVAQYPNYDTLWTDFIEVLSFWKPNVGIKELNDKWVSKWKTPFLESNEYKGIINRFKALKEEEQKDASTINLYLEDIFSLLKTKHGLDAVARPDDEHIIVHMCEDWAKAISNSIQKMNRSAAVTGFLSLINDLSTAISNIATGVGKAIEEIKDQKNYKNSWADMFSKLDESTSGLEKFSQVATKFDGAVSGVCVAADFALAFKATQAYKETIGSQERWLEKCKKIPVIGAIAIHIGEIKEAKAAITNYQTQIDTLTSQLNAPNLSDKEKAKINAHIERYTYAKGKLKKKWLGLWADCISKVITYTNFVLSFIPGAQIVAIALATLNTAVGAFRSGVAAYSYFKKRWKGTLGQEREAVAELQMDDIFNTNNDPLSNELRQSTAQMMWDACIYKEEEIANILTANKTKSLTNPQELITRIDEVLDKSNKLLLRMLMQKFMKDYLKQ